MKRALVAAVFFAAGCSLIIDTDSVRRSFDGGGSGGGSTAGGSGGGGGATAGGAEQYDGGPRCTSSTRPKLRCDAPIIIATNGGPFGQAQLGAVSDGFIVSYVDATTVHVEHRKLDGGSTPLVTEAATSVSRTGLATEGDAWAYIYDRGLATPIRCFSNLTPTGVAAGNANDTRISNVAVAANGAVAVVAGHTGRIMDYGISDAGCPSMRTTFNGGLEADAVSVVHKPGTGAEGFRLMSGSNYNAFNSVYAIYQPLPDGGLDSSSWSVMETMSDESATVSANGEWGMMLYGWSNTVGDFYLSLRGLPTNLDMLPDVPRLVGPNPTWWSVSGCGAGCTAAAWASSDAPGTAKVFFASDDGEVRTLTGADAGWDAVCGTTIDATSIGIAYARGRLSLLVAEPMRVRLVDCDVPPL